jgi:hypothetical protein
MSLPLHGIVQPGACAALSPRHDQAQLPVDLNQVTAKNHCFGEGEAGIGSESEPHQDALAEIRSGCKSGLMSEHFSPQKGGARSNPNERMLIPSYVHMTQPSEPTRSPSKVLFDQACMSGARGSCSAILAHELGHSWRRVP